MCTCVCVCTELLGLPAGLAAEVCASVTCQGRSRSCKGQMWGRRRMGKNGIFFITEIFIMEFFLKSSNWKRLQFYQGKETLGV